MTVLDSIYKKLPTIAQHAAVSIYGLYWRQLRFGSGYRKFVEKYSERELYTNTQWEEWQSNCLRSILPLCSNHVPYYRENWSNSQVRAAVDGDLTALPLLEKEPIRSAPKSFLREDMHPLRPQIFLTSGTTGTPISSYYTISELRQSLALREVRSARWAGVSFALPRATFSGRLVEPNPDSKGPFYRYNAAEKQAYLSAFHLRPDTANQYVDALHRHNIQWGTGYAVSFYILGRFILDNNIPAPNLKAIITTSEKLTPEMRMVIEEAFGCKIFEEYSTVENAIFASECEQGRLHVSPDVSVVEILHPDGTPCKSGEPGEVVVTTLSRTYQPLIRFRLGDVAMWDAEPCPCGRQMPIIKEVVGRIEDIIVGPDSREMVRFHGVFTNQPNILEGQIIQESLEEIQVKVVTLDGFGKPDIDDIISRVKTRIGENVNVTVVPVKEISRTKAGKFQAVISRIRS